MLTKRSGQPEFFTRYSFQVMKRHIVLICAAIFFVHCLSAQQKILPTLQVTDSLQANDSTFLLHAELRINAADSAASSYFISLQPPRGWRLVGSSRHIISGKSDTALQITLLRTRFALAKWSPVKVQLIDSASQRQIDTFFLIRAPWISDFQLSSADSIIELADTIRFTSVRVRVINKGSAEGFYRVYVKRNNQNVTDVSLNSLLPGQDTLLQIPVLLPRNLLESQIRFQVYVIDSFSQSRTFPFSVIRRFGSLKVNSSRFSVQPFIIESGVFLLEKKVYHFHEIRTISKTKEGEFQFSFRTKVFGQILSVERNVLNIGLSAKRYQFLVGQLSDNTHFFSYGRGISARFNPAARQEWGAKIILHTDKAVYSNNTIQLYGRHQQRSFNFLHQLALDLDRFRGVNSYLVHHEIAWRHTDNLSFKSFLASGFEEFKKRRVFHSGDLGVGFGLSGTLKRSFWELGGDLQYFQKSYPGVNKGLRNYQIDIRRIFNKFGIGFFYRYNYVSVPILYDSLYIMDAFKFNMERLGIRYSISRSTYHVTLSTGSFRQTGLSSGQLNRYLFLDKSFGWQIRSKIRLQLSSLSGFSNKEVVGKGIWFTNTSLEIRGSRAGLKSFFVRQPLIKDSTQKVLIRTIETILFSPYLNFKIAKKVPVSLRYTISKSIYERAIIQGLGFSLQYKSNDTKWQIQCNGTVPLTATIPNQYVLASYPYVTLSVQRSIHVPSILKRKYYTLEVVAFEDLNANGVHEAGEPFLRGIRFAVNNLRFITDSNGRFSLQNTATGKYEITAEAGFSYRNLAPISFLTTINLNSSQLVYIPFRKGHVISGIVKLDLDPYSRKQITPENIMINFVDQLGKRFTTLTDTAGKYFINLPAGIYSVSLNETSFTGTIRPVVSSYQVDLQLNSYQFVQFELRERRREMRIWNH